MQTWRPRISRSAVRKTRQKHRGAWLPVPGRNGRQTAPGKERRCRDGGTGFGRPSHQNGGQEGTPVRRGCGGKPARDRRSGAGRGCARGEQGCRQSRNVSKRHAGWCSSLPAGHRGRSLDGKPEGPGERGGGRMWGRAVPTPTLSAALPGRSGGRNGGLTGFSNDETLPAGMEWTKMSGVSLWRTGVAGDGPRPPVAVAGTASEEKLTRTRWLKLAAARPIPRPAMEVAA